jgi:hypothetical protein
MLNLTILYSSTDTLTQTTCNAFTFNGQTYTASGVYTDIFINTQNCDSVIILNLNILPSSRDTIIQTACNTYLFNGQTYTASGIYQDSMMNLFGCDSVVVLQLTINYSDSVVLSPSACNAYSFNGQTYTSSGTYFDTLLNAMGCDSVVTLYVTITSIDTGVTQTAYSLTSNASGASYQWINCKDQTLIAGATNQVYTNSAGGSYAVIVTQNACSDTSNCVIITGEGLLETSFNHTIKILPNPTNGQFEVELPNAFREASIQIIDILGQVIYTNKSSKSFPKFVVDLSDKPSGIYIVEVVHDTKSEALKLIKN